MNLPASSTRANVPPCNNTNKHSAIHNIMFLVYYLLLCSFVFVVFLFYVLFTMLFTIIQIVVLLLVTVVLIVITRQQQQQLLLLLLLLLIIIIMLILILAPPWPSAGASVHGNGMSPLRRGRILLIGMCLVRIAQYIIVCLLSIRGEARTTRIERFELDEGFQPYHPPFRAFDRVV